jgi:hypothetical protein
LPVLTPLKADERRFVGLERRFALLGSAFFPRGGGTATSTKIFDDAGVRNVKIGVWGLTVANRCGWRRF